MWPVDILRFPLPDSLQAREDPHLFELRCTKCWQIVATFSASAATAEEIVRTALAHQCPQPKAVKLCLNCKREIADLRTRCPYCGAANPILPD